MLKTRLPSRRFLAAAGLAVCTLALLGAVGVDTPQAKPLEMAPTIELLSHNLPVEQNSEHSDPLPAAPTGNPRILWMEVTAYCPCKICCGKGAMGLTASGKHISYNNGLFVAADTDLLPFGTQLLIPGYAEQAIEVIDRGGAIKGHKLDVFFDTHERAMKWGRQWIPVTVVE